MAQHSIGTRRGLVRTGQALLLSAAAAVLLSGCAAGTGLLALGTASTEPVATAAPPADVATTQAQADEAKLYWASAYAKNPNDEKVVIAYARVLKGEGDKQKAMSVLQQAAMYNSNSKAIASEQGRLALEMGDTDFARKVLARADDPSAPDWRVLNALGTIEARSGNRAQARTYFERAAVLAPSEPSILNNLALIAALDGDPVKAEQMLKKASAAGGDVTKVRQNLALVLGVQGKFDEAKQIAASDLSRDKAEANIAFLSQMVKATPVQLAKAPAQPAAKVAAKAPASVPTEAWSTETQVAAPAAQASTQTANADWTGSIAPTSD